MENNDMVTVIVPMFNSEQTIEKCIKSILNQTYENFEIIVVDNHSADRSVKIVQEFNDDRIIIKQKEKTKGVGHSRNVGLDNAKGDYIWFVDSDDYAEPYFLECMLKAMNDNDVNIVQCCYKYFNDFGEVTDTLPYHETKMYSGRELCKMMTEFVGLCGPNVMLWNKLYKKEVFKNRRFYENVGYEDMHITYKILYEEDKVLWLADRLMNWRKSMFSSTAKTNYTEALMGELSAYIARTVYFKENEDTELYNLTMKRLLYTATQHLYLNKKIMRDKEVQKREEIIKCIIDTVYNKLSKMDCWKTRTRLRMRYIKAFPRAFGKRSINHTVDFRI